MHPFNDTDLTGYLDHVNGDLNDASIATTDQPMLMLFANLFRPYFSDGRLTSCSVMRQNSLKEDLSTRRARCDTAFLF